MNHGAMNHSAMNQATDRFLALVGDVPASTDPATIRRKSRDFYWYSPILREQLDGLQADCVVTPRTEHDLLAIARAARQSGIFLTARGGGTGNYGQAVPLRGGAIVDMTGLDGLVWLRGDVARVRAGTNMLALDRALRAQGRELRMFPSTKRTATIGGFVCGGSGGIGSVTWGGLRAPGNLLATRVVTMEDEPRAVELRGPDTRIVNHAYGTTGFVTELELPVEPAVDWCDMAVAFPDLTQAARFAHLLATQTGLQKKLVSVMDCRLLPYFAPLRNRVPAGRALVILMMAPAAIEPTRALIAREHGELCYSCNTAEAEDDPGHVPLYELTWNHTTLQVLKKDRSYTYLQTGFPPADALARVAALAAQFPDELLTHLEFLPMEGGMSCAGLPVIRFTDSARLDKIMAAHDAAGISVANPHVYTIEDGGAHRGLSPDLAADKRRFDPAGLLNPGKMRSFEALAGALDGAPNGAGRAAES
ncbi:FAD-binding oxidoreductase [Nguyenibacter vanlangensis]|uniref:FAD-binding oxidoreductase n=2 Tax=Nguyenibacter vanlangensis TaxID=1216886 RepID=A0ABZ3D8Y0_9PROT